MPAVLLQIAQSLVTDIVFSSLAIDIFLLSYIVIWVFKHAPTGVVKQIKIPMPFLLVLLSLRVLAVIHLMSFAP